VERYTGVGRDRSVGIATRYGLDGPGIKSLNLGARLGEWSTPRHGRFTPGKDPEPVV